MIRKLVIGLLVSAIAFFLYHSPVGTKLENLALDTWFHARGPLARPEEVVVVAMDEESYDPLGISLNQPWPRAVHAQLLQRLQEYGVRRVIFDVVFVGQSARSEADAALASAVSQLPVVLGLDHGERDMQGYRIQEVLMPLDSLAQNAERLALVGLLEDSNYVRRFLVEKGENVKEYPTLAQAAVAGIESEHRNAQSVGPQPSDLINYYGPPGTIRTFSYYQVLEREVPLPREYLENKIVFVGLLLRTDTGPAQKDSYLTSFGRMFGVEIHATSAANLLHGSWIRRASGQVEGWIFALAGFALAVMLTGLSPLWCFAAVFLVAVVWAGISYLSFRAGYFIPGASLMLVVNPATASVSTLYYYLFTRRQQRHIERAFSHYVAPDVVKELARNPDALKLGGEVVEATALFTDIENFTAIGEKISAEPLITMLNDYFSHVVEVIFEERGTLIKFIGDAIFVIWGAPVRFPDHAERACRAALRIRHEVAQFNESGRYPPLVTRIGLNSGPMVVGNLGAKTRFDYTAIGDSVNLASRVEGLNKYLGTHVLVSEYTVQLLPPSFHALRMGAMQVVGKEVPTHIYALSERALAEELVSEWKRAVTSFQSRQWERALSGFRDIGAREATLRKACEFYVETIEKFMRVPPEAQWKGEITLGGK